MSNIRRADLDGKKLVQVCSDHFATGKRAALFQKSHPDWASNLRLSHSNVKEESSSPWVRRKERSEKHPSSQIEGQAQHTYVVHEYCLDVIAPSTFDELENHAEKVSSSTAFTSMEVHTELSMGDIDNMEQKLQALESENKIRKEKIISMIPIDVARLEQDEEMILFLTGIPNYLLLLSLFSFLSESVSHTHRNCLTACQEFLLTTLRLQLNLPFQDLAYRFNISKLTASRTLINGLTLWQQCLNF